MGEINRDHQERMLRLMVSGEFTDVSVSTRKAADAYAELIEKWEVDGGDLICCDSDRRAVYSATAR